MPDILVRNLSDGTVAALKALAKKNNRSMQAEVAAMIQVGVGAKKETSFWKGAAEFRERMMGRDLGDSADLIREDRESR